MTADEREPTVLVGARGMLGQAYAALLSARGIAHRALDLPELDITDRAQVVAAIPEGTAAVINCAAFTDVDGAETHEDLATAVNAQGARLLAERCARVGTPLLHFSTDYVFDGSARAPYPVDAPRRPQSAYGRSKARGEEAIERAGVSALVVRTSWLYAPWGRNFVLTMRELTRTRSSVTVVNDQEGRPTSAQELALRSYALLTHGCRGVYHVCDGGQCTWYELACHVAACTQSACSVTPCTTAQFPRPAKRPAYSVLDLSRTEAALGPSRPWKECVAEVLAEHARRSA